MSWLRSAVIYLVITAIFLGAVWLFWGKDLEKLWKKHRENPVIREKIPKEIEKKKAELKKLDIPRPKEAIDLAKQSLEATQRLPANANAEWKKTQSGVEGLVAAQKRENTRDLQALTGRHDNRMIEILKQVKLYKEPKPAALFPPEPVKAAKNSEKKPIKKETAKPKKEPEKKKEPLKPMF